MRLASFRTPYDPELHQRNQLQHGSWRLQHALAHTARGLLGPKHRHRPRTGSNGRRFPMGETSCGSSRHWQPVRSKMALTTARKFVVRGRPRGLWAGRMGAISAHASSVKSVSYRSSFSNTDELQLPNPTFQTPSQGKPRLAEAKIFRTRAKRKEEPKPQLNLFDYLPR